MKHRTTAMSLSLHALSWRWRARRFRQAPRLPAVLLYHSVSERERDPLRLAIPPRRFAAHLEWIARHTTPLPLGQFVHRQQDDTLPADAIALTFDDGYADNLHTAEPLLQRWGIPATVFVTTDYAGSAAEGWWDELDAIFLGGSPLPTRFKFDGFACTVEPRRDSSRAPWDILAPPGSQRERAFLAASDFVRRLNREERRRFLAALRAWSGREPFARPGCGFASWADWRAALNRGVIIVGAHTRSHPALALLPLEEQREEIAGSLTEVRTQLGAEPAGLAYPFGTYHDFSSMTRRLAEESGAAFACANMTAHAARRTSRWELPRVLVWNWDVGELASRLGA